MLQLQPGQCGLCIHFGDNHDPRDPRPLQIRLKDEPLASKVSECDHPVHAPLHLKVTAVSGCQGFEPVDQPRA
jgi:hypothetical protein